MKLCASFLFLILGIVDASTKVAVIELGFGGSVRRTTSQSRATSAEGVISFIKAMHGTRTLQHAGMPVVPDLFKKADAGVIVGLSGSGVNLESMPSIAELFDVENKFVVGHMETNGANCNTLISIAKTSEEIAGALPESVLKASEKGVLAGVKMTVSDSTAADGVDKDIGAMINEMDMKFKQDGKTVVLYLVVEGDSSLERQRRLNDVNQDGGGQQGKYYFLQKKSYYDNQEGGNNGENDENPFAQMFAGYYGYGYYKTNGEWYTPYKSMFQIQYFNVVLWTAVGLFLVFFTSFLMMLFMPLEADTLLFGESAKMIGED
ncbi:hypothetical protein ACA910_000175 [Epithemia clementina (nom. ined.)]